MIALSFKEKKNGRTLGTISSDAKHMSEPLLTCATLPRVVPAVAVTVQENLWRHQLSEVSVVPGYPQSTGATRGHAAVSAVTDTRNLVLKLRDIHAACLVCRMVMERLVAIKRRHHRKSWLAQCLGNCIVGQFPTVSFAGLSSSLVASNRS